MFKNYWNISLRNLVKQRLYSLINVLGLAIGITCCLLIILFVVDELRYDKHFPYHERIYRIKANIDLGDFQGGLSVSPTPLANTLVQDFPEVEQAGRFRVTGNYLVKRNSGDENIEEAKVTFADRAIFDVFSIPLLEGDRSNMLREPNSLLLSKSCAAKYFPYESPIGKTLILDNEETYVIDGVVPDMPPQTHFHFDIYLSMEGREESKRTDWLSFNFHTYFLLQEDASPEALEAKFPELVDKKAGPEVMQFMGINPEDWAGVDDKIGLFLQPLSDIHLHSDLLGELEPNGSISYVYIFSLIALFILFLACINFMNMATARSANRAKEVGVRKVLGAFRRQLISQFLTESLLLSFLAVIVAIISAELLIPYFNQLADKQISLPWYNPLFIPLIVIGTTLIGLIAGIYPAFFLSRYRPIQILKGKILGNTKTQSIRSGLVVFQFAISVILIICTLVINQQLQYIQHKKLGYEKDQVLYLNNTYVIGDKLPAFKKELQQHASIQSVAITSYLPVTPSSRNNNAFWLKRDQSRKNPIILQNWDVDIDYIPTMGMNVIQGRGFDRLKPTDSMATVINESAVKSLGLENPIGQYISTFSSNSNTDSTDAYTHYQIIGVVENFHFESLREAIAPLGLFIDRSTGKVIMRVQTTDIDQTLAAVADTWEVFAPGQPFDYEFLDESFAQMYRSERRLSRIFNVFAGLSIFVACLGLFALATFMAEQRNKEIGIRKVLGASVAHIIALLTRDFVRLVCISLVIALPLAGWLMYRWLENFEYKTALRPQLFITGSMAAVIIAVLTISYQSIRAAIANPVQALKDE